MSPAKRIDILERGKRIHEAAARNAGPTQADILSLLRDVEPELTGTKLERVRAMIARMES